MVDFGREDREDSNVPPVMIGDGARRNMAPRSTALADPIRAGGCRPRYRSGSAPTAEVGELTSPSRYPVRS